MPGTVADPPSFADIVAGSLTETPAYIYNLAVVRRNLATLRAGLPSSASIYYSLKANPHPALLRALKAGGARAEVCSPGELTAALEAGWAPDSVLYTGPGKRDIDLHAALKAGVRWFSIDSAYGLDQLERACVAHASSACCLLRINDSDATAGHGLAMTGVASQFGVDCADVLSDPRRFAGRDCVKIVGLHLYMGSNLMTVGDLISQFERSLTTAHRLACALAPFGVRFEILDLGGGFGAPFATEGPAVDLDELRPRLTCLLDQRVPGWRDGTPEIAFESGRFLVGSAGTLVISVLDAKRSHGKDVIVLDSGINHLGGMSGLRRLAPLNPRLIMWSGEPARADLRPTMVTGPLCTPLDTWSRAAALPPLEPGDLLAVPGVGAYGLYASLLAFLGHPAPVEVIVDSDRPQAPMQVSRLTLTRVAMTEDDHNAG